MTRRKTRNSRWSCRPASRQKIAAKVFRLEALENRTCYSVDLGVGIVDEKPAVFSRSDDAPITWYFAQTADLGSFFHSAGPIGQSQVVRSAAPLPINDAVNVDCEVEPLIQSQGLEVCDDQSDIQARPLINTVSGNFVDANQVAFRVSIKDLTPETWTANDNWLSFIGSPALALPAQGGHESNAFDSFGNHDPSVAEQTTQPLGQSQSTQSTQLDQSSTRSFTAESTSSTSQAERATIAPLRQLSIPEGEASTAVEAAARRGSTSTASPSTKLTSLDEQAQELMVVDYLRAVAVESSSVAWVLPGANASANQLQNMVRAAARSNQLPQSGDRFGWTGLLGYQVPPQARASQVELDARPQLAPIPKLESRSAHETTVFKPLNADRLSDDWQAAPPLVRLPQRLPSLTLDAAIYPLPNLDLMTVQLASSADGDQPTRHLGAEESVGMTVQQWFLAAIPALLFIPRRLRDRLWQFTSPALPRRRRSTPPLQPWHD